MSCTVWTDRAVLSALHMPQTPVAYAIRIPIVQHRQAECLVAKDVSGVGVHPNPVAPTHTAAASADVRYNLDGVTKLQGIMGCFNALGTVAFAYGGHNVVLEIQASQICPMRVPAHACASVRSFLGP